MHSEEHAEEEAAALFEPRGWEERYAGPEQVWSGNPNTQLVTEASRLTPGTALDVGCGEGGDVIWLAQQGWHRDRRRLLGQRAGPRRPARRGGRRRRPHRLVAGRRPGRSTPPAAPGTWSPRTSCTRQGARWSESPSAGHRGRARWPPAGRGPRAVGAPVRRPPREPAQGDVPGRGARARPPGGASSPSWSSSGRAPSPARAARSRSTTRPCWPGGATRSPTRRY